MTTLRQAEASMSYASGHVIFAREKTLMAQPFDLEARQLRCDAFPLADSVTREGSRYVGVSVSENGTLVDGRAGADMASQLTWFDRTGQVLGTLGDAAPYAGKDGRRFLVNARPQQSSGAAPLTVVLNWTAAIQK